MIYYEGVLGSEEGRKRGEEEGGGEGGWVKVFLEKNHDSENTQQLQPYQQPQHQQSQQDPQGILNFLAKCPYLVDLHHFSSWSSTYQPSQGDLSSFLLRHSSPPPPSLSRLFCFASPGGREGGKRGGGICRLPPETSIEHLRENIRKRNGRLTVAHLLGVVTLFDGVTGVPFSLLGEVVEGGLREGRGEEGRKEGEGEEEVGRYVVGVVGLLPGVLVWDLGPLFFRAFSILFPEGQLVKWVRREGEGGGLEVLGRVLELEGGRGEKEGEGVLERVLELEKGDRGEGMEVEEEGQEGGQEEQEMQPQFQQQPQQLQQQPRLQEDQQPQLREQQPQPQPQHQQPQSSQSAKSLISTIRHQEYGLPLTPSPSSSPSSLPPSAARLGRAIKRLSEELYSSHVHFVEELIQNADDNIYILGEKPSLAIAVWDRCVVVYNNERGFREENVRGRNNIYNIKNTNCDQNYSNNFKYLFYLFIYFFAALCDVGRSTKEKDSNKIGEKGLFFPLSSLSFSLSLYLLTTSPFSTLYI